MWTRVYFGRRKGRKAQSKWNRAQEHTLHVYSSYGTRRISFEQKRAYHSCGQAVAAR